LLLHLSQAGCSSYLKAEKVGVVWSITAEGKQALLQNEAAPGK
jgi:hypothetical protein